MGGKNYLIIEDNAYSPSKEILLMNDKKILCKSKEYTHISKEVGGYFTDVLTILEKVGSKTLKDKDGCFSKEYIDETEKKVYEEAMKIFNEGSENG